MKMPKQKSKIQMIQNIGINTSGSSSKTSPSGGKHTKKAAKTPSHAAPNSSRVRVEADLDIEDVPAAPKKNAQPQKTAPKKKDATEADLQNFPTLIKQQSFTRRDKVRIFNVREMATRSFYAILALGFFLGLLFFARPSSSALENRNLTAFPEFTWETFLDGQFFSELSLWYADTFPFREQLVGADQALKSLYGIQPEAAMVGGKGDVDEIPEEAEAPAQLEDEVVEPPNERVMAEDIQNNIMQGLYVKDGAAYSIYYFDQKSVEGYAAAINACAEKLEGKANVYSILVPNNSGVMLSDEELVDLGGSDQAQAIKYFNSLYNDKVIPVNIMDTLREHNNEYLYFRTDHHWTQLGAYYAYVEYCKVAGIEPVSLEELEKQEISPFLGTFYQQLSNDGMSGNPDVVEVYFPKGTNEMRYLDSQDGIWHDGKVIQDTEGWAQSTLYNVFASGDQPLEEIHNTGIDDGSSCLIVKDSFGNAFIPMLVDNYEYVYVIDFRFYSGKIPKFVEEKDIKNVIFMNNLSMAGTTTVAQQLATLMK